MEQGIIESVGGNDVVISQPWGGLGDNLQFSTLPERFARMGRKVYISDQNALRNPEIGRLVLDRNPYISGITTAPPNAGACFAPVFDGELPPFTNFIQRVEEAHGLVPESKYPKIYYSPAIVPEMVGKILIDVSAITFGAETDNIKKYIQHVFKKFRYRFEDTHQVQFPHIPPAKNTIRFTDFRECSIESLQRYCDVLFSCSAFITVNSGAHSLAVAIKQTSRQPVIHCYVTPFQYNWRAYIYDSVEYFVL